MNERLIFMLEIIQKLGKFQREHFRTQIDFEEKSSAMDMVSFVDKECEKTFRNALKIEFPEDEIMGEESYDPNHDYSQHKKLWIIDPLDGTLMYQRGIPTYLPMIAYVENGVVQCSAVYFPEDDTLYHADENGAYRNNEKIEVSKIDTLKKGIFNVSTRTLLKRFTYEKIQAIVKNLGRIIDCCPTGNKIRMCLDGQAEGAISFEGGCWDAVPGGFLIQQAGGKVTNFGTDMWNIFDPKVIISNGLVHDEFQKLLEF